MNTAGTTASALRARAVGEAAGLHRRSLLMGLIAIAIFFGGLGAAAALTPLDAAVVAQGFVIVSGRSETVATSSGGRVLEVLVTEGQEVQRGDVLVRIDTADRAAEVASTRARKIELEAQRAQLLAADQGIDTIQAPSDWAAGAGYGAGSLQRRQAELESRRASLNGDLGILDRRLAQIAEQLTGLAAQRTAVVEQVDIADVEIATIRGLVDKGLATLPRLRQEERGRAQLAERLAAIDAEVASLKEKQPEISLQKSRLQAQSSVETRSQLAELDRLLAELEPRLLAAEAAVKNGEVRATTDGRVMSMTVRNAGDAVAPGEPLLGIVPVGRRLVVELRISPRDADDLAPGMVADIRFVGVGGRMARTYPGRVIQVSPDRVVDERTDEAWFNVQLDVDDLPENDREVTEALRPGLPAEGLITLRKRTVLDYLVEPLNQALWRSMREN